MRSQSGNIMYPSIKLCLAATKNSDNKNSAQRTDDGVGGWGALY